MALSVKRMPLAQVTIPVSWDGVPHPSCSLLSGEPAPPSPSDPPPPCAFSLSNK